MAVLRVEKCDSRPGLTAGRGGASAAAAIGE